MLVSMAVVFLGAAAVASGQGRLTLMEKVVFLGAMVKEERSVLRREFRWGRWADAWCCVVVAPTRPMGTRP
ncbi:hypothetical protein IWX46DRAFT_614906 [Phyllosticta citricarpa]|uniref:Secreted protein n=1 Tax=Phyllosticta citricarpa TaxID=55181 RepID=A0ABR1L9D7_9PEZI